VPPPAAPRARASACARCACCASSASDARRAAWLQPPRRAWRGAGRDLAARGAHPALCSAITPHIQSSTHLGRRWASSDSALLTENGSLSRIVMPAHALLSSASPSIASLHALHAAVSDGRRHTVRMTLRRLSGPTSLGRSRRSAPQLIQLARIRRRSAQWVALRSLARQADACRPPSCRRDSNESHTLAACLIPRSPPPSRTVSCPHDARTSAGQRHIVRVA